MGFNEEVGQRIAGQRKLANKTQDQVAEMLNVTTKTISSIEQGQSRIHLDDLIILCLYLGINLDDIITDKVMNALNWKG